MEEARMKAKLSLLFGLLALPCAALHGESVWDAEFACEANVCDEKSCGCEDQCCSCYCYRFFGDYLYLRARDAEVVYAVEANSNLPPNNLPPIQTSPLAVLDQDPSSGFRVGFGVCIDPCSEFVSSFTHFESATNHRITTTVPGRQIEPMVIHPATESAVTGTVEAAGRHDIDFDFIDLDYRRIWLESELWQIDCLFGVRWGRLEQNFSARFTDALLQPINETEVVTDIDFSGTGIRFGFDAERDVRCRLPMTLYVKGWASILAGEFDAVYQQTIQNNAALGVNTGWKAGRIVPTFDLELGAGFYSPSGCFRATAGYVFSVWNNVVKTEDLIHAVQTNDFRDMNDSMTFDGLVARAEIRF